MGKLGGQGTRSQLQELAGESPRFSLDLREGPAGWDCCAGLHVFSCGRGVKEELVALSPEPLNQEELWHWAVHLPSPRHTCPHYGLASGSKMLPRQGPQVKSGSYPQRCQGSGPFLFIGTHPPRERERHREKAGVPSIMRPLTHNHNLNASAFFLDLPKS